MKRSIIYLASLFVVAVFYSNCSGFKSQKSELASSGSFLFVPPESITLGLFKIDRSAVRILPFDVRINKLNSLIGSTDVALYAQLNSKKIELGSYDFARGVSQDLTWTDSRLASWTQALQPYCSSLALRTKFPFPAAARGFIESALGRDLNAEDQSNINDVTALAVSNDVRLEVLCYVTLSSLEYVAQ
ncbi:MAG: hypothetical protein SGJ18_03840 [Pseudomonadota bacterium]|nr:hypothetical protein [Pseudomonadota bacterium]